MLIIEPPGNGQAYDASPLPPGGNPAMVSGKSKAEKKRTWIQENYRENYLDIALQFTNFHTIFIIFSNLDIIELSTQFSFLVNFFNLWS